MNTKIILRIIGAVLATGIGLYPAIYFIAGHHFGILQSKNVAVLNNVFWNIGFYNHILFGGIALLTGWTQFNSNWRNKKLEWHRTIGKIYISAAIISSICALFIAFYAQGGIIASLGFLCLGIIWLLTTLRAFIEIRNKQIVEHQKMMTYSYASCFAAVTLRIYLPVLTLLFHDFTTAYQLVAWLCWVPNIIVAYIIVKRLQPSAVDLALT